MFAAVILFAELHVSIQQKKSQYTPMLLLIIKYQRLSRIQLEIPCLYTVRLHIQLYTPTEIFRHHQRIPYTALHFSQKKRQAMRPIKILNFQQLEICTQDHNIIQDLSKEYQRMIQATIWRTEKLPVLQSDQLLDCAFFVSLVTFAGDGCSSAITWKENDE